MKKSLFLLIGLLLLSMGALTSCDETKEADPYADWKVRNEHFLDSIADVAHAHEASGNGRSSAPICMIILRAPAPRASMFPWRKVRWMTIST